MSTPQLTRLPNTVTARELWEVTMRDGGCIVEQHLDPDLVRRLNLEFDPWMKDRDPLHGLENDPDLVAFTGAKTKRLMNLPMRSKAFAEAVLHERLVEWTKLALPLCSEVQISSCQVIELMPGQGAQPLHRDEVLYPHLSSRIGDEQILVNCMHALTDFDEALGATRVVPNTHRCPKKPAEEYDVERDSVPAVMKPGDALFWLGSLVHGGGQNKTTNRSRRGLACSFSLGWLKQEEAYNLEISPEEAKTLPPRLRELLGFAAYRSGGAFSYFYDMADPYVELFGEARPTAPPDMGSFQSPVEAKREEPVS